MNSSVVGGASQEVRSLAPSGSSDWVMRSTNRTNIIAGSPLRSGWGLVRLQESLRRVYRLAWMWWYWYCTGPPYSRSVGPGPRQIHTCSATANWIPVRLRCRQHPYPLDGSPGSTASNTSRDCATGSPAHTLQTIGSGCVYDGAHFAAGSAISEWGNAYQLAHSSSVVEHRSSWAYRWDRWSRPHCTCTLRYPRTTRNLWSWQPCPAPIRWVRWQS